MKAILEFTLPDEQAEFRLAQQGGAYRAVVEDIDGWLRSHLKYDDDLHPDVRSALESVLEFLYDSCRDSGVDPWEEP